MGINLTATKLLAFGLGASFSGFAGSIYAAIFQYIDPGQFDFSISIILLAMVIVGGLGNIWGVIAGGFLMGSLTSSSRQTPTTGSPQSPSRPGSTGWRSGSTTRSCSSSACPWC